MTLAKFIPVMCCRILPPAFFITAKLNHLKLFLNSKFISSINLINQHKRCTQFNFTCDQDQTECDGETQTIGWDDFSKKNKNVELLNVHLNHVRKMCYP